MNLDALVAPLRAEVVSGATAVGRRAADVLRRVAEGAEVASTAEFRDLLSEAALRILDAQPTMANLVHLGARVLRSAEEEGELEDARRAAAGAAADFRSDVEAAGDLVASRLVELLPEKGRVVTLSASSTVAAAVVAAVREGRELEVVCLESRPMSEGRDLARRLARADVPVVYAVDAAAWSLTRGSAAVLLGADSIGDAGVVNKIGSRALAEAAHATGAPVFVAADRTKLLPPGFPQLRAEDRPAEQVWKGRAGVRIWNRYFEPVPLERVRRVALEDGALSGSEIARLREGLSVPEPLSRWAERQEPERASRV